MLRDIVSSLPFPRYLIVIQSTLKTTGSGHKALFIIQRKLLFDKSLKRFTLHYYDSQKRA